MKRVTAFILALVLLLGILPFSGCAVKEDDALSMGQWLSYVADSFGMQSYTQDEPYFGKVGKDDPFYAPFQMAAEWGIVDPASNYTSDTPLTWGEALVSLVNAGEFLSEMATDKEKIQYAIDHFDHSIRKYWTDRYIRLKDAIPLLDTAQKQWANKTYTEKIEKISYADQVKDLTGRDITYLDMDGEIVTTADAVEGLSVGDVYTLPANEYNNASINRVESIEIEDGKAIITNDASFGDEALEDCVQELRVQETSDIDFSKISGIYDEYGNPIVFETSENEANGMACSDAEMPRTVNLKMDTSADSDGLRQVGLFDNFKGSLKFQINDNWAVEIGLEKNIAEDSGKGLSVKITKTLEKATNRHREMKKEAYVKATFYKAELTKNIDYSWGKLHSATVKLDYSTKIEGGIKKSKDYDVGKVWTEGQNVTNSLSSVISGYQEALVAIKHDAYNTKFKNDEIYICRIAFLDIGVITGDFIIKGKVTAEGELKIVIEVDGSNGIQYNGKNVRYIKNKSVDTNFVADGKLEVTIGPGVSLRLLKKRVLAEITVDCGAGVSTSATAHLVDAEWHELYSKSATLTAGDAEELSNEKQCTTADEILQFAESKGGTWNNYEAKKNDSIDIMKCVCVDWQLYPIVRLNIGEKSTLGGILSNLKVNTSLEIVGSKNVALKGHIDWDKDGLSNFNNAKTGGDSWSKFKAVLGIGAECKYEFTPWDNGVELADESEPKDSPSIASGNRILLSTQRVTLDPGQTVTVQVDALPAGYTLKDLKTKCEDEEIATFDVRSGVITAGKKSGVTRLVVSTEDGKFKAECAIYVTQNNSTGGGN